MQIVLIGLYLYSNPILIAKDSTARLYEMQKKKKLPVKSEHT